jgi:hypothetical protein
MIIVQVKLHQSDKSASQNSSKVHVLSFPLSIFLKGFGNQVQLILATMNAYLKSLFIVWNPMIRVLHNVGSWFMIISSCRPIQTITHHIALFRVQISDIHSKLLSSMIKCKPKSTLVSIQLSVTTKATHKPEIFSR